jgi:hypothetical protein
MSESIGNIAAALVQFQGLVQNPKKDAVNPHFNSRYAELDTILTTIRPALHQCGLTVHQNPVEDENGNIGVYTYIFHKSGEYMVFDPVWIPKNQGKGNSHSIGSALTYAKRYALSAVLGIATDDDDDGNAAAGPVAGNQPQHNRQSKPAEKKAPVSQVRRAEAEQIQQGNEGRNLDAWKQLAANQQEEKKASNPKGRFFAIAAEKNLTEKQQKAIVFGLVQKTSRKDVTDEEFTAINKWLAKASDEEIKQMIKEAAEAYKQATQKTKVDTGPITDDEINKVLGLGGVA